MLNWEDYHKEETTPASSAVLSMPTTPEQSAEEPAVASAAAPTPKLESVASSTDPMAKAIEAVEHIDIAAGLEELEMGAARVSVDEKAMINCLSLIHI